MKYFRPPAIMVTKSTSEQEPFQQEKLLRSLKNSGASPEASEEVLKTLQAKLSGDIHSSEIFQHAYEILKHFNPSVAARYNLKQAVLLLGPTGYPFEDFISKIFLAGGYQVQVGIIMQGKCVSHEVDVLAIKDNKHVICECKFHNQPAFKSDIKVALYVHARFNDIVNQCKLDPNHQHVQYEPWIITNTAFTSDALAYCQCSKINALSWNYPREAGLLSLIEAYKLYPVTCLSTLGFSQKQFCVNRGMILCKDLFNKPDFIARLVKDKHQRRKVMQEIEGLLQDQRSEMR